MLTTQVPSTRAHTRSHTPAYLAQMNDPIYVNAYTPVTQVFP